MIQNKLLFTVSNKLFPKVLRRLDDHKNTCIFAIPDDYVKEFTREELKMEALVDDLEGKELLINRYNKNILVYHHPYYLIIPIFEYFVFKTGKVNQYLNSLEIKMDKAKSKTGICKNESTHVYYLKYNFDFFFNFELNVFFFYLLTNKKKHSCDLNATT
jgi:hypothetical protein